MASQLGALRDALLDAGASPEKGGGRACQLREPAGRYREPVGRAYLDGRFQLDHDGGHTVAPARASLKVDDKSGEVLDFLPSVAGNR